MKNTLRIDRGFDIRFAKLTKDPELATVLQQIHYWLQKEAVGKIIDGVKYVYNTYRDWVENFPFWSEWQVRSRLNKLRSLGIVVVIRYWASKWKQTNFYTIDYDRLADFMGVKTAESTEKSEMCNTTDRPVQKLDLDLVESHTSSYIQKNTSKEKQTKQIACSLSDSFEKCDIETSKVKNSNLSHSEGGTSLKSDLKLNSDVSNKSVEKRSQSPEVEVKINNKEWRSHLDKIDQLGIKGNKTIVNALKTFSKERVEAAIALYRARKRESGYIENPCGYFLQALKEDWAGKKTKQIVINPENAEDEKALFEYWFKLAKEFGHCSRWEMRDGDRWVLLTGAWRKFSEAWEQGWTINYLKKN